jgi:2-polyprenyl-3-methyl-5-hydroxy-6-metoxy-1,4-benzoquinol methylase
MNLNQYACYNERGDLSFMYIPNWVKDVLSSQYRNSVEKYIEGRILNFARKEDYVSSFSFEWNNHKTTQLGINREDNMNRDMWSGKINAYEFQFSTPKITLDAGCGVGRFSEYVTKLGGKVIGVDLSDSVHTARENNKTSNSFFIKADLNDLPFEIESFDNIISIGVLHHTPNPESTFLNLVRYLKPGGTIFIWVYEDSPDYIKRFKLTKFLNIIPHRILYQITKDIAEKILEMTERNLDTDLTPLKNAPHDAPNSTYMGPF